MASDACLPCSLRIDKIVNGVGQAGKLEMINEIVIFQGVMLTIVNHLW